MERLAFTVQLKPERIQEYIEVHRAVWPSVLEAIRRAGVKRYSIFLRGTELFFYLEAENLQRMIEVLSADPEHQRWNREVTESMFVTPPRLTGPGAVQPLQEVFRFEADPEGA